MAETTGSEILDQYRNISNKLKKRFLRKPNVTEACESFTQLGQHCENAEMPSYAGLCWIAAARCEGSLGNIPGETSCLTRSARQFLTAEEQNTSLGCPSPNENLQAALSCYSHAASRYPDNCPLTINLNLEIADSLQRLERIDCSESYLKAAVEQSRNSLDTRLFCLERLASYHIQSEDYLSALETLTEVSSLLGEAPKNGARSDCSLRCEITRILLLLILRPSPQKLAPNLTRLLEKYTWGDKDLAASGMSQVLYVLLQSLVLTCQSSDSSSLPEVESELWRFLNVEQKNLLRILVKVYC